MSSETEQSLHELEQGLVQSKLQNMASSPNQSSVTVAPAEHVLKLVSNCVVNQCGFANTCGIPLGAHMDLQFPSALELPRISDRPPLRCKGCAAFFNAYCKINPSKGVWKCNMCGGVNIHKDEVGGPAEFKAFPELRSEAVEYVCPLPPSCPLESAHEPGLLVIAVDATLEPRDMQAVREALLSFLTDNSIHPATSISLLTFDGCVAVHNLGAQRCSHVLPTGAMAAAAAAGSSSSAPLDLQSAVQQLLDRHCVATAARRAATATDAKRVAAAAAAASGGPVLVSDLSSCAAHLPRVLSSWRTVQSDVPPRARARCLCSAVEVALRLIAAHATLDLTRHHKLYGSRVIVLTGGPATRGPGAVPLELLDQAVSEKGRAPENRTVAAALDVGAALGDMAAKIGVAVDILTSTSTGINAPLLTAIAHGSGGELVPQMTSPTHLHPHPHAHHRHEPQPDLSASPSSSPPAPLPEQQQQQDQQQPVAGAGGSDSGGGGGDDGGFIGWLLSRQLMAAWSRRFGVEGRVDCYCSEGLRLVQWLGPLEPIQVELEAAAGGAPAAAAAAEGADPYRLSSSACGVVAVETGRCVSLRFELTRDLNDVPSLLLQVVLNFVDPVGRLRVVRVVTRRISVVESRVEFLRGIHPVAAAVMLGKKAVLDAKRAGGFRDARKAEEARYAVAAQLALVASRCGQEAQATRGVLGFGGRKSWQWPPELMPLGYALYHLQRGPLLGPPAPPPPGTFPAAANAHLHGLWDSDARLSGFNALLRAAWADAYRAMAPKLYVVLPSSTGGDGASPPPPRLVAVPCVNLAAVMARTAPLLLDVGTAVLVSQTEEPGHVHGGGGGGNDGCLTSALLAAAMQAVATSTSTSTAGSGGCSSGGGSFGSRSSRVARFPVPSVVLTPGAQAGGGVLASRLIPVHRDDYQEQCLQHPQLQQLGPEVAAQLSKQLTEAAAATAAAAAAAAATGLPVAQAKQAAAAAVSFADWCRGVHVRPFPPLASLT